MTGCRRGLHSPVSLPRVSASCWSQRGPSVQSSLLCCWNSPGALPGFQLRVCAPHFVSDWWLLLSPRKPAGGGHLKKSQDKKRCLEVVQRLKGLWSCPWKTSIDPSSFTTLYSVWVTFGHGARILVTGRIYAFCCLWRNEFYECFYLKRTKQ